MAPLTITPLKDQLSTLSSHLVRCASSTMLRTLGVLFLLAGTLPGQALFSKISFGPIVTTPGESRACVAGDIDLDNDIDLFVANAGQASFFYKNDGTGGMAPTSGPATNSLGAASDAILADLDNDGDPDLFVTRRFGGANALFWNQGGLQGGVVGSFVLELIDPLGTSVGDATCAAAGDVDGDGDMDVAITHSNGLPNALFINQGGAQLGVIGTFLPVTTGDFVLNTANSNACALGDVDGDGDLDLVVANGLGDDNALYLNDGTGVFTLSPSGIGPGGDTLDCAFVDLDGDGDLDLLFVNFLALNQVYRNRGNLQGGVEGVLDLVVGHPLSLGAGQQSFGVAVGDWNDDDLADVVIVNCCGQNNALYENVGGFAFTQVQSGPASFDGGYSYDACFFDFDGDGDEELFVANGTFSGDSRNALYRNDLVLLGAGFTDLGMGLAGVAGVPSLSATGTLVPGSSASFLLGDAAPLSLASLVVGFTKIDQPFKGGTLVPSINFAFSFPTDVTGAHRIDGFWPPGIPTGFQTYYQAWIVDLTAVQGFAASNALKGVSY